MSEQYTQPRDGLLIGLIAYAAVAAFYSAFDLLAARGTLFTVNLLGLSVFQGMRDPSILTGPVPLDPTAIGLYNAVHLAASILIGFTVIRLVGIAEREPSRRGTMLALIAAGFVVTILAVGWLSTPIRVVLPWWSIVVANSAAVVVAAAWLGRRRPGLVRRLFAPRVVMA
jgi:hypothetical protein